MTQDDLDRLERAMAKGVKSVTFSDGRTVTFASFEELSRRINYVRQSLGQQNAEQVTLAKYSKGVQT